MFPLDKINMAAVSICHMSYINQVFKLYRKQMHLV